MMGHSHRFERIGHALPIHSRAIEKKFPVHEFPFLDDAGRRILCFLIVFQVGSLTAIFAHRAWGLVAAAGLVAGFFCLEGFTGVFRQ